MAWVRIEGGRVLCARPRGKDVFYVPGGKREGAETDLQVLLREISEELTVALRPETVRSRSELIFRPIPLSWPRVVSRSAMTRADGEIPSSEPRVWPRKKWNYFRYPAFSVRKALA